LAFKFGHRTLCSLTAKSAGSSHYATVADGATALVQILQSIFKTKLISLCGQVRRQSTTVECIEIIAAKPAISFNRKALRKILIIQSSSKDQTKAHTRCGVSAARKGGLTKNMTWNAMCLSKIEEWIRQ